MVVPTELIPAAQNTHKLAPVAKCNHELFWVWRLVVRSLNTMVDISLTIGKVQQLGRGSKHLRRQLLGGRRGAAENGRHPPLAAGAGVVLQRRGRGVGNGEILHYGRLFQRATGPAS